MGALRPIRPVLPFAALLYGDRTWYPLVCSGLKPFLGSPVFESEELAFENTDYYAREMGGGLIRRFVAFAPRRDPDALAGWKNATNRLEEEIAAFLRENHAAAGLLPSRPVNIDPGYLALSKLVLASTKDFAHRVYLGSGIYAEITLLYRRHRWENHHWTFPEYRLAHYHAIFERMRQVLMERAPPEKSPR